MMAKSYNSYISQYSDKQAFALRTIQTNTSNAEISRTYDLHLSALVTLSVTVPYGAPANGVAIRLNETGAYSGAVCTPYI